MLMKLTPDLNFVLKQRHQKGVVLFTPALSNSLKKFATNVATGECLSPHFSKIDQISIFLGTLNDQLLCSTNNTLSASPFLTLKVSLKYNKYSKIQNYYFSS